MNETVNQEVATEVEPVEEVKQTFTQDELNDIVGKRLARAAEKYADYEELKAKAAKLDELEEASKSELQKATERAEKLQAELSAMKHTEEVRSIRDKVAQATGVPASLLTGETEEACTEQAAGILSFKTSANGYPAVKDAGELQNTIKGSTRQQFAQWAEDALN